MVTILLPTRASDPSHCRECDGPREDPAAQLCDECAAASLLQRIEWRYQNGEGVVPLFDNDRWSITREFHPLNWALGIDVEFSHVAVSVAVTVGPWSIWAGWYS